MSRLALALTRSLVLAKGIYSSYTTRGGLATEMGRPDSLPMGPALCDAAALCDAFSYYAASRQPKCGRRRRLRRAPLRPVEAGFARAFEHARKPATPHQLVRSALERHLAVESSARWGEGTLAPVPSAPPLSASPPPAPSLLAPPSSPPPRGAQSGRSGGRFSARREERTSAAAAAMRWLTRSSSPAGQTRRDS